MQQRSDLLCRDRSCRAVLGEVENGTLRPKVEDLEIRPNGATTLRCPACGAARVWLPRYAFRRRVPCQP